MKDFMRVSPLRILEASSRKGLGPGNLGVLIARAGLGKTACLIHVALNKIFRDEKLVHLSLEEAPEKVNSYYEVIFHDLVQALGIEDDHEYRLLLEKNRVILAYLKQSFEISRLRTNLTNLSENMSFVPQTLIVDGLDFEKTKPPLFEGLKEIATEFRVEMWFSALSHRHIPEVNERGIPYPCHQLDEFFSLILDLQPEAAAVCLRVLKDHDGPAVPQLRVRLDPDTLFVLDRG
jgi:hypothetical protein